MRYCKKCGNQLSDDMLFCQKCGTKVEAAAKEERPAATYPVLENIENTPTKQKAKNKNGARVFGIIALVLIVVIFIATIGSNNNDNSNNADGNNQSQVENNGNSTEQKQDEKKSGEDYELLVWEAFWEGASDYFGVEYSAYKMWDTVYDYIQDFETSDGYTAHYYLIRTAFETTNVLGQKITHQVTARCYYAPEYSNTVYTTYMMLNGETVYYDEETECWLMAMDDGGSAPATSEESTGILWSAFVNAYNEMAAEDPEGNGYLIDAEISGNTLEYSFPNGETLSVDVTNGKHIIRMEYIYPSTGTTNQTIIMHRWWVISSIVGAIQHELYGNDWSEAVSTKTEDILADVALAGGSDEDKATYQSGKALTSSDLEHSIIYTRYVDLEKEQSHFIVYGYSDNVITPSASSKNDSAATPTETTKAEQATPPTSPTENAQSTSPATSNPSFTGSTCLDINYNGDGMPASNVTNFSGTDMICVAGRFSGIVGENNVKIIWTCPDGYVFTDQQYCYKNGDTLQSWKSAEDIGSGSASVSIVLDTTGETLATYYFTVTGAPTYTNDTSTDTTNSYDDPYGEMDDVNAELAYQEYLENLPSLDDVEWETDSSDLDGISTTLTDEELAALEAASGN